MAWIELKHLSNSDFIDFDTIDDMINDIYFLRAAIPEVWVRKPTGKTLFSDGTTTTRLRIQSGVSKVPSFRGPYTFKVTLIKPNTGTADYPIQLTLTSHIDIRASVYSQNNKEFYVRLLPTTKSSIRGAQIHWLAITQE